MLKTAQLHFTQIDTLFFRDGKSFGPSESASSRRLPMPQTLLGAIRTWLLEKSDCDLSALGEAIRGGVSFTPDGVGEKFPEIADITTVSLKGPWFFKDNSMLFPVPATLVEVEYPDSNKSIERLDPLRENLPGWDGDLKPLWRKNKQPARRITGKLITADGMKSFLNADAPKPADFVDEEDLYGMDRRVGIGIDKDTATAKEGLIYSANMLSLKNGVGIYCEITASDKVLDMLPTKERMATVKIGGEGKHMLFYARDGSMLDELARFAPVDTDECAVVLLTPAHFNGWKPESINTGELLSAAVSGFEAVSGWDMAKRGPKQNRFAVSAGSVYYLKKPPASITKKTLCAGEDAKAGYGTYVIGRFNYA